MSMNALRAVAALLRTNPADLNPYDRLVLYVLADAADETGRVTLGSTRLAERVGMLPGNARRHRGRLTERGYLAPVDQPRAGRTTTYRIPVQAFVSLSTTRVIPTRVDEARSRHSDAGVASYRRGGRVIATRDSGFSSGTSSSARDDDTPAAFTDADTARAWLRVRARFAP